LPELIPEPAMRTRRRIVLIAAAGGVLFQMLAGGQDVPGPPPAAFVLQAGSRWAKEIDQVLAGVAMPTNVVVPAGRSADEYLAQFCAGKELAARSATRTDARGRIVVLAAPCVRVRRNVKVEVTAGDTLEGLAVRHGLPRTAASELKVLPGSTVPAAHPRSGESLKIGDVVVIPEVPVSTNVVVNPALIADRASLVAALARALRCQNQPAEECLTERGVTLLNRGSVPAGIQRPDKLQSSSGRFTGLLGAIVNTTAKIDKVASLPEAVSPAAGSLPVAAPPATIPVAAEQWPYDVKLLAQILRAAPAGAFDARTTIGVAEGGLGDGAGEPLPGDLLAPGLEKAFPGQSEGPEPDGYDTDDNGYIDDLFGAGVAVDGEAMGTGDLGLCRGTRPGFESWPQAALESASHGIAVGSIATARRLRDDAPETAAALPKLVFFRMLGSVCDPKGSFRVAAGEMWSAFQYLRSRSRIINMSYRIDDQETGDTFRLKVRDVLPQVDALLFLPAGNDTPGNLDTSPQCPACLGNDSVDAGGPAAKRTIVVGAATRDLRRALFSNYGEHTVKLFAPGEPVDAVDLIEQRLPPVKAATSYASPYAALAAAMIRAYSSTDTNTYQDVRDRLEAATWPLTDPDNYPRAVGVVDLVKAAAVRHHSIEVKEMDTEGRWVRRTYVGTLQTPLKDLQVCPQQLRESAVHALRLGDAAADGTRPVRVYRRHPEKGQTKRRVEDLQGCRPAGTMQMRTLAGEDKTFALDDVTHILLRWVIAP
jgi:hypothetical protein